MHHRLAVASWAALLGASTAPESNHSDGELLTELSAELGKMHQRVLQLERRLEEASANPAAAHHHLPLRPRGPSRGWLDVQQFGAVPDDGQDDTISIQSALDAAAQTGGTVHVPVGVFDITGLHLQTDHGAESDDGERGVRLVGDGRASVLRMAPGPVGAVMYDYQGSYGGVEHLQFRGDGNATAIHVGPSPETTNNTLVMTNWNRFVDIYIQSVREGFIFDEGPNVKEGKAAGYTASGNWYNTFESIHIQGAGRGFWARSSPYVGGDGYHGTGGFNDNSFVRT